MILYKKSGSFTSKKDFTINSKELQYQYYDQLHRDIYAIDSTPIDSHVHVIDPSTSIAPLYRSRHESHSARFRAQSDIWSRTDWPPVPGACGCCAQLLTSAHATHAVHQGISLQNTCISLRPLDIRTMKTFFSY